LIGRFGLSEKCVRLKNNKFYLNDSGLTIKSNNSIINNKFVGYYMINNQNNIYNCSRGTAQKNLDIELFKKLKIKIPSIEQQNTMIQFCEENYELIIKLKKEIIKNEELIKNILNNT